MTEENITYCSDCGIKIGEKDWITAIIPDKVWKKICPDEYDEGERVLCVSCVGKRLEENGYKERFRFGFLGRLR
jgi:hypothetical protein